MSGCRRTGGILSREPSDERGLGVRRDVLGDDHVDRAIAATTSFDAAFQEFLTRTAWGDVWARPGLDRRMRSAITLAVLTALRAEGEIAMHVRAARRNGLSDDEIAEVLLHTAVYAGLPAANAAFRLAKEAIKDAQPGDVDEPDQADSNGSPT